MGREKVKQTGLELTKEDQTASEIENKRIINFDLYFQLLMARSGKVASHHKAPMKMFAEQNGLNEATEEEFDDIFKAY